jgi:rRNA maturation protein Nop10
MFSIKELKTKAVTPPGYDSEDTYLEYLIKEEKASKKVNSSETLKALSNL